MTEFELPDIETPGDRVLAIQSIWNAMASGEIDVNTAHRLAGIVRPAGNMAKNRLSDQEADRDTLKRLILNAGVAKEIDADTVLRLMSLADSPGGMEDRWAQLRRLERMLEKLPEKSPPSGGD